MIGMSNGMNVGDETALSKETQNNKIKGLNDLQI
jgi:hypothetical protein